MRRLPHPLRKPACGGARGREGARGGRLSCGCGRRGREKQGRQQAHLSVRTLSRPSLGTTRPAPRLWEPQARSRPLQSSVQVCEARGTEAAPPGAGGAPPWPLPVTFPRLARPAWAQPAPAPGEGSARSSADTPLPGVEKHLRGRTQAKADSSFKKVVFQ